MNIADVGAELILRRWDQGSFLSAKSALKASLARAANEPIWQLRQEAIDDNDYLVIVSHPCDIIISPTIEPYAEVMRAYRTTDRGIIYGAGKRNSLRRFLLRRQINKNGELEGLIADATIRVSIEKQDLLAYSHQTCFDEDDKYSLLLFRQWLAARYYRQALPNSLVKAITGPIIKAIENLSPRHAYQDVFNGVGKILFQLQNNKQPFEVELFFELDERKGSTVVTKYNVAPVI